MPVNVRHAVGFSYVLIPMVTSGRTIPKSGIIVKLPIGLQAIAPWLDTDISVVMRDHRAIRHTIHGSVVAPVIVVVVKFLRSPSPATSNGSCRMGQYLRIEQVRMSHNVFTTVVAVPSAVR